MKMRMWCLLALVASTVLYGCAETESYDDEAGTVSPPPAAESPAIDPLSDSDAPAPLDPELLALKIDPVCKMDLEANPALYAHEHDGETYGFCSELCRDKFIENPDQFIAEAEAEAALNPTGTTE